MTKPISTLFLFILSFSLFSCSQEQKQDTNLGNSTIENQNTIVSKQSDNVNTSPIAKNDNAQDIPQSVELSAKSQEKIEQHRKNRCQSKVLETTVATEENTTENPINSDFGNDASLAVIDPILKQKSIDDLAAFFEANRVKPTIFTIPNDVDTILVGEKGNRLLVYANSFAHIDGQPIKGDVKIEFKECMSFEDIYFEELTTHTPDGVLESGGMFHIKATADGEEVDLRNNAEMGLISKEEVANDMFLYYADRDEENRTIWEKDEASHISRPKLRCNSPFVDTAKLNEYYSLDKSALRQLMLDSASWEVSLSINTKGKIVGGGMIDENYNSISDSLKTIAKLGYMDIAEKCFLPINSQQWRIPVKFTCMSLEDYLALVYTENKEELIDLVKQIKMNEDEETERRGFSIRRLGWINIDHPLPAIRYKEIRVPSTPMLAEANMRMIVDGVSTVLHPRTDTEDGYWVFDKVLPNRDVYIISTVAEGAKIRMAYQTLRSKRNNSKNIADKLEYTLYENPTDVRNAVKEMTFATIQPSKSGLKEQGRTTSFAN
ncbi:MAG: hypothetical protein MK212_02430 [Saprospiraceae bacterium]|nr:hypothetical protein [Saprospiraceae bacterium]